MKKFIILLSLFLLVSCSQGGNSSSIPEVVPPKVNAENLDVDVINTTNLDDYLFRDDVFYVDLRYYSWVLKYGYIAGFSFIPYYSFIAVKSETSTNALFRQAKTETALSGDVGSFKPVYVESVNILKNLFPQDKKIFLVSESGLESYYMAALLTQYGYETKNIYNVGGVSNQFGPYPAYKKVGKYFVPGNKFVEQDLNGSLYEINLQNAGLHLIEE